MDVPGCGGVSAGGGALGVDASTAERPHDDADPADIESPIDRTGPASLFAARDRAGVKLLWPDHDLIVGDAVAVELTTTDEPVTLGDADLRIQGSEPVFTYQDVSSRLCDFKTQLRSSQVLGLD